MGILKKITDFIYRTDRVKREFLANNPTEKLIAADASKGIMSNENSEIQRGMDWVTSQRAVVLLTNKRIKCGKWDIPLENIESAKLIKIKTTSGPGQVLKIATIDNQNYQFGMQLNNEWIEQKTLPLTVEQGKVRYSLFSIVIRLILIGYIIYWIIGKIK